MNANAIHIDNPYNRNRDPYPTPQQQQQQQTYNPNRPRNLVSAGLKRKFQNPKQNPNNNGNNSNSNAQRNSNHGVSKSSRSQSSSTNKNASNNNNSNNSNNNNNNNEEDDEELPEELKGLDKELITKIENEIVDNGDSITFKDIAGLNDAKQTVMELVCWPMKRPDLFTGLRRGPNGLLL